MNTGSWTTFEKNKDQIYAVQYSAIIDAVTSNRCLSLDGSVVKYGSTDYTNFSPPQHIWCRSIWIGINKDEEFKPEITWISGVPVKNTMSSQEKLKTPVLGNSNKAIKQVKKEISWLKDNLNKLIEEWLSNDEINNAEQKITALQKAVDKVL